MTEETSPVHVERVREGTKAQTGTARKKHAVDFTRVVQHVAVVAVVASAVAYIASFRYAQKKAQHAQATSITFNASDGMPPNSVWIDRRTYAVQRDQPWLNSTEFYTPGHPPSPVFQVFDKRFLDLLGPTPRITLVAQNDAYMWAHEAPVWIPGTDEVFMSSHVGFPPAGWHRTNVLSKISLREAESRGTATITEVHPVPTLEMVNGGTPYEGKILFVNSGRAENYAPNLALMEPAPPFNTTVILDNYFGIQFNSLNDAKIHPVSKAIFFTDPSYGYVNNFRPKPKLPANVYRYDPRTGALRVVEDSFVMCNGLAFSQGGRILYIADSGAAKDGYDSTRPQTIYAFDVEENTERLYNRRFFAHVDTGIPDGLAVDAQGNVYASAGDGVHVFDRNGILLGKIFVGAVSANMAFAGRGRLVVLAETKLYLVHLANDLEGADLEYWRE